MRIRSIKNNILSESIKYPLLILITLLITCFIYTYFDPLPSAIGDKTIGLGANILDIGDRDFYFNETNYEYGYGEIKGGKLYPSILKFVAIFISNLGFESSTKLWNIIIIFLASLCAIISLFLIDKSANIIFNKRVANISCLIFVFCPYTIFYCLNGSITIYMILGCSFLTYLLANSKLFNNSDNSFNIKTTMFLLLLGVIFLSSLRPTGILFSLVTIILLGVEIYKKYNKNLIKISQKEKIIIYFILTLCFLYCFYEIKSNYLYLNYALGNFISEKGTFFGFEREAIRDRLFTNRAVDLDSLKSYVYLFIWKTTDFVSGLSDIRDTHSNIDGTPFLPFLMRTFTGIFFVFPFNLLSFFGLFIFFKKIFSCGLYIPIISSLFCLVPNLIGVANTRYLVMVYPPFIILSSRVCVILLDAFDEQNKSLQAEK